MYDEFALPHSVTPVLFEPVAGADSDVVGQQQFAGDGEDFTAWPVEGDGRSGDVAGVGAERQFVFGSAEPFVVPGFVRPHSHGFFDDAPALLVFLHDHRDRELVELHDRVDPEEVLDSVDGASALRFGFTDRTHTPRAVAVTSPRLRSIAKSSPSTVSDPVHVPVCRKREVSNVTRSS